MSSIAAKPGLASQAENAPILGTPSDGGTTKPGRRSSRGSGNGPKGRNTKGQNSKGKKGSGKKRRRIPRGLIIPLAGSLLFHSVLFAAMFVTRPDPLRSRQLTDIEGFESMLAIPPPPMPDPEPIHEIAQDTAQDQPAGDATPDDFVAATPAAVSATFFNPITSAPKPAATTSTPASRLLTRPKPKVEAPKPVVSRSAGFGQMQAQRASKVVYAVDVSGAMVPVLPFLLQELRRSVERLDESQSFQVIFFRAEDQAVPAPPSMGDQMLRADRAHKRSLDKIVDKVDPGGRADPLAGLARAISLKPDVVFLLSRNIRRTGTETQTGDEVLSHLESLNPKDRRGQRPVVIKTIQFIDDDPTGLMQSIAHEHGDGDGSYRVMSIAELKKAK